MIGEMPFKLSTTVHNNNMLKHDSAHLEGACCIFSKFWHNISRHSTSTRLVILPFKSTSYIVQNESYHLSIDKPACDAAYGQSSRISNLPLRESFIKYNIQRSTAKKPGFGYALTIIGENLFWGQFYWKHPGNGLENTLVSHFPKGTFGNLHYMYAH